MVAFSNSPIPAPPYSAGQVGLTRPISQAALKTSIGNLESRSHSAAIGMIRSLVNRRAVSISALCSSLNEKSTTLVLLFHALSLARELGAHRARPEDVAAAPAHHQREGDVDDVLERHLPEVRHLALPRLGLGARALELRLEIAHPSVEAL